MIYFILHLLYLSLLTRELLPPYVGSTTIREKFKIGLQDPWYWHEVSISLTPHATVAVYHKRKSWNCHKTFFQNEKIIYNKLLLEISQTKAFSQLF